MPNLKSLKRGSKFFHSMQRNKDVIFTRHLSLHRESRTLAQNLRLRRTVTRRIRYTSNFIKQRTPKRVEICLLTAMKFPCHHDEGLPVIQSVSTRFQEAPDYRTYLLEDRSFHNDDKVARSVAKWSKPLQVQMRSQMFNSFDQISILRFLSAFMLPCYSNGVYEVGGLCLLHCFVKHHDAAALNEWIALKSKSHKRQKQGTVTSYCELVDYFLGTHATDRVIAKTDTGIMQFTQASNKSPTKYANALWNKAPRGDRVYA